MFNYFHPNLDEFLCKALFLRFEITVMPKGNPRFRSKLGFLKCLRKIRIFYYELCILK